MLSRHAFALHLASSVTLEATARRWSLRKEPSGNLHRFRPTTSYFSWQQGAAKFPSCSLVVGDIGKVRAGIDDPMLTSLHIENFRCFDSLTIERLARVNLFVGLNNAGKTSVLDAAQILISRGDIAALRQQALRRGEILELSKYEDEADLSHLFRGHVLAPGSAFVIEASSDTPQKVKCSVSTRSKEPDSAELLELIIESNAGTRTRPLSPRGSLKIPLSERSSIGLAERSAIGLVDREEKPISFFSTAPVDNRSLGVLWDGVVLTVEEVRVSDALKLIEPGIERIAYARESYRGHGSFFIKLSGTEGRIPLGSMGDGVRRLLALSLYMARSAGGFLFMDEIDTGLHYSVMARMWRLVIETARRLDIQVFATTHSLDCILAIAELCEQSEGLAQDVLLHRIERDAPQAVTYSADMLRVAAEQQMEVRGHAAEAE